MKKGEGPLRFTKNLIRIFHTDCDKEVAKADEARQYRQPDGRGIDCQRQPQGRDERERASQKQILTQGCMNTYRSSHSFLPTQHSSAFRASTVNRHEI